MRYSLYKDHASNITQIKEDDVRKMRKKWSREERKYNKDSQNGKRKLCTFYYSHDEPLLSLEAPAYFFNVCHTSSHQSEAFYGTCSCLSLVAVCISRKSAGRQPSPSSL